MKRGGGSQFRLTEYQQFFPGTPAFCQPLDSDVNRQVVESLAHRRGPKKPLLESSSEYSDHFKQRSPKGRAHTLHPFEATSKYKRSTVTPKSLSHDQHCVHKNLAYAAKVSKCDPKANVTTGGTCEMWVSSYQKDMCKKAKDVKKVKDRSQKASDDVADLAANMGVKDLWKMLCHSSYELAFQPPGINASQSEPSLRAATAPSHARRQFKLKDPAQLPSMSTHAGRTGSKNNWNRSMVMNSSTTNLPAVS